MNLRIKLLLSITLVISIIISGLIYIAVHYAQESVLNQITEQFRTTHELIQELQTREFEKLINILRIVATSPRIKIVASTQGMDHATILYSLEEMLEVVESDLLMLLDTSGRVLANTIEPESFGEDLSKVHLIHQVLQGDDDIWDLWIIHDELYLMASQHIHLNSGETTAIILSGKKINNSFAISLSKLLKTKVAFILAPSSIIASSTIKPDLFDSATTAWVIDEQIRTKQELSHLISINDIDLDNVSSTKKVYFDGENHLYAVSLLANNAGERLGSIVVLQNLDKKLQGYYQIRKTLALVGLMAIACAGFVLWLITRPILKMIGSVVGKMKEIAKGEAILTKRIDIESNDEIGHMVFWFNEIINNIQSLSFFKRTIEEDETLLDIYFRLGKIFKKMEIENFTIYDTTKILIPVYPFRFPDEPLYCKKEILNQSSLCWAKRTGRRMNSVDFPGICTQFCANRGKEAVCVPLNMSGNIRTVIQFLFDASDKKAKSVLEDKINKISQFIREAIPAMDSRQHLDKDIEHGLRDQITDLYNMAFFQEHFDTIMAGVASRNINLGIIVGEIDNLNLILRVCGKFDRDALLFEYSKILKANIKQSDLPIRIGDREFLLVLFNIKDEEQLYQIAERIRVRIKDYKGNIPLEEVTPVTISLGLSMFPADNPDFWQVKNQANKAFNRASEFMDKVICFSQMSLKDTAPLSEPSNEHLTHKEITDDSENEALTQESTALIVVDSPVEEVSVSDKKDSET
ncbi:MAG: diguanylate cyclase [SAR324 cluster bacterium]|nr:diguanylate cyclase [SAR324 cluster bacterium]